MEHQDHPLRGIALMLAFCVLAPLLDASAKLATASLPVGQITCARFVVQAALMLPVARMAGAGWRVSRRDAGFLLLRAVLLILSTFAFVAGVTVMPIADALAIVFVEPFILLILGHLLFGDQIGLRRIIASVIGFCGALLVIRPSLTAFGLVALFPLATAFLFAGYMLVTRAMAGRVSPILQQLHTALIGSVICLPILWLADGSGLVQLDPVMPRGLAWLWLFGVGFWAALSHLCMTWALRYAPASTLAPIHYLEIISAVVLGYLIFGDFPTLMTWIGIAVITVSGVAIIQGERAAPAPAPSAPKTARGSAG